MFKKALSFFVLMLTAANVGFAAPNRAAKVDVGFNVSASIPDDSDVDTEAYIGGTLAYGVNEWMALGVEAGWIEFGESEGGVSLDETAVPVLADIILRVPTENAVQPYAVVGLGAIFWDAETNIPNVEVDVDTAFAAKIGGGVDWFVNDNWAVNFEASYVFSDAEGTVRNTTTGASLSAEGETDYWMVGGGLKYLFS